jgi:hypothetical protein
MDAPAAPEIDRATAVYTRSQAVTDGNRLLHKNMFAKRFTPTLPMLRETSSEISKGLAKQQHRNTIMYCIRIHYSS